MLAALLRVSLTGGDGSTRAGKFSFFYVNSRRKSSAKRRNHTKFWLMFYAWGREFLKKGEKKRKRGRFQPEKVQKHEEFHKMSPREDGKTADDVGAVECSTCFLFIA